MGSRESKSQKTKAKIVRAATSLIARRGVTDVTYEEIAQSCEVTKQLVQHYFPDKKELFVQCAIAVRETMQRRAVKAIDEAEGPLAKLESYVASTFSWVAERKSQARLWALFYYYCGADRELRRLNAEFARIGQERIATLIRVGQSDGVMRCSAPDDAARAVQVLITGALISVATEEGAEAGVLAATTRTIRMLLGIKEEASHD